MPGNILVGTQGWNYRAWIGPFYPPGARQADLLGLYAQAFSTVEVDSTFYAIPPDPVVAGWQDAVPPAFRFALKVPQAITHEKRLVDADNTLTRFLARVRPLGDRLGPLLLQLSPEFRPSERASEVLASFCAGLSEEFRWAIEFRHPGWLAPPTLDLLRARRIALVLVEGRWIKRGVMLELGLEPTADFAYVRWMGPDRRLTEFGSVQADREREIGQWRPAMEALSARVTTLFGYVNNHFEGHAPQSARSIQRAVGQAPVDPSRLRVQQELF
jgi:uncharacterized protein YecE (DUF72 family)